MKKKAQIKGKKEEVIMCPERPKFDPKEFEVVKMHQCGAYAMFANMGMTNMPKEEPIFNRPISSKENFKLLFSGQKPMWMPNPGWAFCEVNNFRPREIPDNLVCHLVFDQQGPVEYESNIGRGWFGLDWVYVPVAGGATVDPGHPLLTDINDWEEVLQWPDLDEVNWTAVAKNEETFLDTPQLNQLGILCGLWERLMSLMDVENAAIALIDEDQEDALKAFFDRYSDFLIEYIKRAKEACPSIDSVLIHDDWGHQNSTFFSLDTAMEMLVPYLRKITDYVHSQGMLFELHSCGRNETLVPAYIAAGVDWWAPQPMNNYDAMTEKYKDQPIWFAFQDVGLAPDATEEEAVKYAAEFYEKYKDRHVMLAPTGAVNPAFMNEIYRLSREYLM